MNEYIGYIVLTCDTCGKRSPDIPLLDVASTDATGFGIDSKNTFTFPDGWSALRVEETVNLVSCGPECAQKIARQWDRVTRRKSLRIVRGPAKPQ